MANGDENPEPPEREDESGNGEIGGLRRGWEKMKQTLRDPPMSALLASILAFAASFYVGWMRLDTASTLTALALFPAVFFFCFERYVNKPKLGSSGSADNDNSYHPDLRVWGYGLVLGAGLAVLYLFARVVISSLDRPSSEASASTLTKTDSILATATDANVAVADSTLAVLAGHSVDVASLALWHDGLLLFFLSAALVVVMYALVHVSRSEI